MNRSNRLQLLASVTIALTAFACGSSGSSLEDDRSECETTCAGCCLNGVCQTGITAAACGKNGQTCSACGNNQICRTDQRCGVDPTTTWRVRVTGASIAQRNNGELWDGDGSAPDVLVRLDCPPLSSTAWDVESAERESYSPEWTSGGCTATAGALLEFGFAAHFIDVDLVDDDSISQPTVYSVGESLFVSEEGTLPSNGALQSATFSIAPEL